MTRHDEEKFNAELGVLFVLMAVGVFCVIGGVWIMATIELIGSL